jgi:hypothetical protein
VSSPTPERRYWRRRRPGWSRRRTPESAHRFTPRRRHAGPSGA